MALDPDSLQSFCRGKPELIPEGGFDYIALPSLRFRSAGQSFEMNAVLVPGPVPALGGYTTRLLLERGTGKQGLNWTAVTVLGRTWHTWSWNNVPAAWSLREILAAHLGALE